MQKSFQSYVVAILFDRSGAVFALSDGTVRFEGGETVDAHDGAVLSAALHPSGDGVVTGGDDGRLVWSRRDGARPLADLGGKWLDAVAASPETGLIAVAAGRELIVRDAADPAFERRFRHERTVTAVAFDPKGRRIMAATYGGVMLWYARIADQKPTLLKWPGAHVGVAVSPDGKFVLSAMQENALHGWRLQDAKDMKMAGYPGKIRSLSFMAKGALLATSGAPGVVIWPFAGANGPMGREAVEIGVDETSLVTHCAGARDTVRLIAGRSDGQVWTVDLNVTGERKLRAEKGAAVSAVAVTADGRRVAFGDEDGEAAVIDL
jgi:WD40 repeat protein